MSASPKHPNARIRSRQTAARQLAAQEGISYQQALRRLQLPWFAAVIHLALSAWHGTTPATELQVALEKAPERVPATPELLALDCLRDRDGALEGVVLARFQAEDRDAAKLAAERICEQLLALPGVDDAQLNSWEDLLCGRELNLRLHYLYRDANNYKTSHSLVLAGLPRLGDLEILRAKLDYGDSFIPGQVGLPDLQGDLQGYDSDETLAGYEQDPDSDPDHPWHELDGQIGGESIEITDAPATSGVVWSELCERFRALTTWDMDWPYR